MKANAPDKLYLIQHNGLICYCRNNENDIEYTRTDAFIEKACKAYCKMCKMPNCNGKDCKFIENFKNYMEGEQQ